MSLKRVGSLTLRAGAGWAFVAVALVLPRGALGAEHSEDGSPHQPQVFHATSLGPPAPSPTAAARPSGVRAILVGAAAALVPLAIGGLSMGFAESLDNRNLGFLLAGSGLVTAPLLSHGVQGEWARGAVFSLPSLACEGVMIGMVAAFPEGVFLGTIETRTVFTAFFTGSGFFAIAGIVDAALAGDRQEGRGPFAGDPDQVRLMGLSPGVAGSPYGVTVELSL